MVTTADKWGKKGTLNIPVNTLHIVSVNSLVLQRTQVFRWNMLPTSSGKINNGLFSTVYQKTM